MHHEYMSHCIYMHSDMHFATSGRTKGLLMNDDFENEDTAPDERSGAQRPLGYWLRLVDGLISREFATAFEGEGVTRRDWMLLNALSGDVDAPGLADRLARKGGKRLRRLEQLGWAEEQGDGTWALTDEGRDARERLGEAVSGIRSRVAGAVSPEDYGTMLASLEAIARDLGWDESQPFPRGRGFGPGRFGGPRPFRPDFGFGFGPGFGPGRHHGFGPNRHHGFEPGFGPGHHHGFGPGHHPDEQCGHEHRAHPGHTPHEHAGHAGHGHGHKGHGHHGRGARKAERAYERGFAAGFAAQARPEAPAADPAA